MAALASSIGEKLGIADAEEKVEGQYHRDPQLKQLYQDEALRELLRGIEAALNVQEGEPAGLEGVEGIGDDLAESLKEAGLYTVDDLKEAGDETLLAVDGIGKAKLKAIRQQLQDD